MHGISSRNPHVLIQQDPFLTLVSYIHAHRLCPELHCEKPVSSINTRITCIPQLKDENISSLSKPAKREQNAAARCESTDDQSYSIPSTENVTELRIIL